MSEEERDELRSLSLRAYRRLNNFSQEEMAHKLNVSLSTYRNWETNRFVPTKNHIKKIDQILKKFKLPT